MNTGKKWMIGVALAGLLALGGTAVYAAAPAQATPTAVDEEADTTVELGRGGMGRFDEGGPLELRDDLLANSLGITVDELQTARQTAYQAALADAVKQGTITQAQADRFQDNPGMGLFLLKGSFDLTDADTFLAQALSITVDELKNARDNAISKGVEAGLLTQEEGNALQVRKNVADAMLAARTQAIADAVKQGLLTQEQADAMLVNPMRGGGIGEHMGLRGGVIGRGMRLFGLGQGSGMGDWFGGEGMHGGRGGMMGRGGLDDSNNSNDSTDSNN